MIMNIMEMLEREIDIFDLKTEDAFRKFVMQSDKNELRISVISTNGMVIADTTGNISVNSMSNHTNRSDVIRALHSEENKTVFSIHTSISQKIPHIYASKKIKTDDYRDYILRISMPIESVNKYLITFLFTAVMVVGIVIIIMALVLPSLARNIMIPFYSIKETLDNIDSNKSQNIKNLTGFNDINDILYDINELAIDLNNNITGYQTEREKLNYVLENIAQGIVAINKNKDIFFINQFAVELLNMHDNDCLLYTSPSPRD